MTIPSLNVWSPGIGVFSSDWGNTAVQGGCLLANLRSFTGLNGMTVYLVGFTAQGDGGQGTFVWNGSVIGTDDGGVTTIVPYGTVGAKGCWIRQFPGYLSSVIPFAAITNIASLRTQTTATLSNSMAFVEGYYLGADGGEGMFWYNASDTSSADNGGTIIIDASGRRWYREGSGALRNIRWFGGNPAQSDCTTALNSAINSLGTGAAGGQIFFPRGNYTFLSGISTILPASTPIYSLTLAGAGADATQLYWPSGGGFAASASSATHSIHFRDLSFVTGTASTGTVAVSLTNTIEGGNYAQNDFFRCTFRGSDGGAATLYWGTGINIQGWNNFNYNSCLFYGPASAAASTHVYLAGYTTGSFKYTLVHNFDSCGFYSHLNGIVYGTYVQGVTVNACNFTNGTNDIIAPGTEQNAAQLTVSNSQFAGVGTGRISLNGPIAAVQITGSLFFVNSNQIGIAFNNTVIEATIVGNAFSGDTLTQTFGINVASPCGGLIVGNSFYGLSAGVDLAGSPNNFTVALNSYPACTNKVIFPGSNNVGVITP